MKTKTLASAALFCLIFALAFCLRQFTFWLPHWQGDQSQYVMLAMKLDAGNKISFSDYNLSGINTETIQIDTPGSTQIIFPYRVNGQKGFVMETYERSGLAFLNMPFFYRGPLLPIALVVSHKLFAPKDQPFAVVKSNLGKAVLKIRPPLYFKTQFWVAILPFASSLLILSMIFFWSRRLFGDETALIASFIFATNPVSILTASRVWTEDLSLLFLIPAMIGYRWGLSRGRAIVCFAAGILAGLAILGNQKALLAVAGIGIYTLVVLLSSPKKSWKDWLRIGACGPWWAFLAGAVVITGKWFWTIYRYYGNPFWQPELFNRMMRGGEIASLGGGARIQEWYDVLLKQPHGLIYYVVGTAAICWPLAAGYLTLGDGWKGCRDLVTGRSRDDRALFLWCWILPFAAFFLPHRTGEYRYLFLAYPALIILSAWMLARAGNYLARFTAHPLIAKGVVVFFLALSAFYSVRMVQVLLWEQKNLIVAPWS